MSKFIHKKSLGQNFLKTESILDLIADSADIKDGEIIIEIGPGEGALTKKLLAKIQDTKTPPTPLSQRGERLQTKLICIEKDHRLIPILQEKFSREIEQGSLELLEKDILKWDLDKYIQENKKNNIEKETEEIIKDMKSEEGAEVGLKTSSETKNSELETFKYKLVANIPYYITGAIIEQFLSYRHKPSCIIIMVQKEVADRVVSKNGKESILSLCTKYYGDSEIIKVVKPGNFVPAPKVDSAILKITLRSSTGLTRNETGLTPALSTREGEEQEKTYLQIVKKGLAHKRKKLSSNLKDFDNTYNWPELFTRLNIDSNARGEDLNYEKFLEITRKYLD